MDSGTLQAAAAASSATYRSFADATRSVLDLLERQVPAAAIFLAHLDQAQTTFRVVDVRGGAPFDLRSNLAMPLSEAPCSYMAAERGPRRCDDVPAHELYGGLALQQRLGFGSYLGVPVELSSGNRVGALAAIAHERGRFTAADEQLFGMLARVLAYELERESNARDVRKLNESMRAQARGLGALEGVAQALARGGDARVAACRAACELAEAQVAFLLEPSGRDFVSTAAHGADVGPVTIRPRPEDAGAAKAFSSQEAYFVADAQTHPALAAPLVERVKARSARFEPVLRDDQVVGVLLLIWQAPLSGLPDASASALRLLASQAAAAIGQQALRARADALMLSDGLTGLASRRLWDEELPRELARARRYEQPVSIALLDMDRMQVFNRQRGRTEGDRLLKETAATWRAQLRDVDLLARLAGAEFGVVLPSCGLTEACEVLERVREVTPRGQTASAGVARWDGEEPAELLLARCRDALAAAKAAGRDMIISSD